MQNNNVIQLPGKTPTELAFAGGGATRAATVTAVRSDGQVQVHLPGTALPLWAYVAMRPVPALNCGDQVLVSRDKESAYVLGVIQAASDGEPSLKRIQAKSGLHAELVQVDGKEQLEVRDAEARLLLRHDSETGRTTLTCENGDLAFAAPEGNIEFAAGGEVRVLGRDGVHLTSGGSSFSLLEAATKLKSRAFELSAQRADLGVRDLAFAGERLRARLADSKLVVDRLETVASHLTERCKEALREVEGLSQLRAGRMRSLIKEALFMRAGHASIEAEEDIKIDGQRVHLG